MKKKAIKNIIIIGIVLIAITIVLIAATALMSSGFMNMQEKNSSAELSKYIERVKQGGLDELSLTIYYMSPNILTRMPVSVKVLKENYYELKVTVSGFRLREHTELIEQLGNAALTPIEQESYINARLYYVFKTKTNRTVYSVCMWGSNGGIIVNGVEVEEQDIFYEAVIPFLPEDAVEELEEYKNR